jgi:hypothetical protein
MTGQSIESDKESNMLTKQFTNSVIFWVCVLSAIWTYDYYAKGVDRFHEPIGYGDMLIAVVMIAGAIYGAADAIIEAIRERAPR